MKDKIKKILREGLIFENRIKFNMVIPEDIIDIKDVFKRNGYKLYLVGGCVRDAILNKTPKDFDLATDALPDKVEEILKEGGFRTLPTGKAFGVINVFTDKGEYEIATFRAEVYDDKDKRRPNSVEFSNIETDSKRRDLTINALYYDIDTHEIVDLVGGFEDIKNGIVRTVGAPEDRFNEDKLRILRAIRFSARFGNELDPKTDAALKKDASLEGISGERIRDEFIKGIKSAKSQKNFLELIDKYNLFDYVFKGLNINKDFINRLGSYNYDDYITVLASLLKNNNLQTLKKTLNDLKYSADEVKAITFLIAMLNLNVETAVALKRAEEHAGVTQDQIRDFCGKQGVNHQLLDAFEEFKLSVTGPDAMLKTGLKQGKELGVAIHQMETDNFKKLIS